MAEHEEKQVPNKSAGKRVFKLITNEVIFGNCESVQLANTVEILIKQPFIAQGNGKISPYMSNQMGNAPGAIQIHPMNVIWAVPLDEFPEVEKAYVKETSGFIL